MNRDLALRDDHGPWEVAPLGGDAAVRDGVERPATIFDLERLMRSLREWRWLILGTVAVGVAIAVLVTLLTDPMYRAPVVLEVNPPRVEIIEGGESDQGSELNSWEFMRTQIGLLKSRSLAQRVAEDLNLANNGDFVDQSLDPTDRLRQATSLVAQNILVQEPADGQLIRFDYVSESPHLAAGVANAYADAFINSTLQRRYDASTYARNFLQRQIAKTRIDLERSERQLVAYAQQQGIIDTRDGSEGAPAGDGASLQGQSLVALNQALAEATARRVAAEGAYRQASSSGVTSDVTTSTLQLREARAGLEAQYQEKRTLMKPEHPEMVSLRSRIDELDRQIAREGSSVASSRANTLLADYRAALAAERALQNRVASLKGDVLDLRGRSIRYAILQRDVDTNRALYDALLQRYKEIGVAGGIGAAPVSIVDRAEVPTAPYKPNLLLNLLVGLGLGLVAGVIGAIVMDIINDTIATRADVRRKLGLACLGAIPKRARKASLLSELEDPGSLTSEAYSGVATSLRFSTDRGVPKTLLITSARAGEGKSSSALSLAHHFARQGKSVLLMDADLRKPVFRGGSDKQGLTKLLTSDEALEGHAIATELENLWLLPCGPVPPNPADLLSSGRFRSILNEASARFDFVIVDAPPVLGLADAPLLASVTEAVILIVESGKTRTPAAIEALNRLRAAGANILGATLTKSTEERSRYGYGYGYGQYRYSSVEHDRNEIVLLGRGSEA